MLSLHDLKEAFLEHLADHPFPKEYSALYDPANYIMSLGGKRIRPILVLAALDALGVDIEKGFNAAMSVEVFHNFSLVHDDIMDDAKIRRGQACVHEKWDLNSAILSGDVMLIYAYEYILAYDPKMAIVLMRVFNETARQVCEGQRLDMDFELRDDVEIEEYIHMISYKTAVLLACSLKMGAILAGADDKTQNHFYEFGKNLGIAFQIQDDLIDTFGDQDLTGKIQGGDILQNKKTYLYLKSLELLSSSEAENLKTLYKNQILEESEKIAQVKALFKAAHVQVHAEELKNGYRDLALSHLAALDITDANSVSLLDLVKVLDKRNA